MQASRETYQQPADLAQYESQQPDSSSSGLQPVDATACDPHYTEQQLAAAYPQSSMMGAQHCHFSPANFQQQPMAQLTWAYGYAPSMAGYGHAYQYQPSSAPQYYTDAGCPSYDASSTSYAPSTAVYEQAYHPACVPQHGSAAASAYSASTTSRPQCDAQCGQPAYPLPHQQQYEGHHPKVEQYTTPPCSEHQSALQIQNTQHPKPLISVPVVAIVDCASAAYWQSLGYDIRYQVCADTLADYEADGALYGMGGAFDGNPSTSPAEFVVSGVQPFYYGNIGAGDADQGLDSGAQTQMQEASASAETEVQASSLIPIVGEPVVTDPEVEQGNDEHLASYEQQSKAELDDLAGEDSSEIGDMELEVEIAVTPPSPMIPELILTVPDDGGNIDNTAPVVQSPGLLSPFAALWHSGNEGDDDFECIDDYEQDESDYEEDGRDEGHGSSETAEELGVEDDSEGEDLDDGPEVVRSRLGADILGGGVAADSDEEYVVDEDDYVIDEDEDDLYNDPGGEVVIGVRDGEVIVADAGSEVDEE